MPCGWWDDSSLLLWKVLGKWSPRALVLLKLQENQLVWQVDLLTIAQRATLARTQQANPSGYRAAKKANAGHGSAYPDGFTIDVSAVTSADAKPALPLKVTAELTSNPKGIEDFPKQAQVDAQLTGMVDARGKFVVKTFHLGAAR